MLRALPYLLLLAAVVAGLLWVAQRGSGRRALPSGSGLAAPAVLAFGPDRGPGRLQATATQLVFTGDAGRVLVIERLDITGVGLARDLPDRRTAAPVLVITTDAEVHYFQLDKPQAWVQLLT